MKIYLVVFGLFVFFTAHSMQELSSQNSNQSLWKKTQGLFYRTWQKISFGAASQNAIQDNAHPEPLPQSARSSHESCTATTKKLSFIRTCAKIVGPIIVVKAILYCSATWSPAIIALTTSKVFIGGFNLMLAKGIIDALYACSALIASDNDKEDFEKRITKKELLVLVANPALQASLYAMGNTFNIDGQSILAIESMIRIGASSLNMIDYTFDKKIISADFASNAVQFILDVLLGARTFSTVVALRHQTICPYVQPKHQLYGTCEALNDGSKLCCEMLPGYVVDCCLHPQIGNNGKCMFFDLNGVNSKVDSTLDLETEFYKIAQMCKNTTAPLIKFGPVTAHRIELPPSTVASLQQQEESFISSLRHTSNLNRDLDNLVLALAHKFSLLYSKISLDVNSAGFHASVDVDQKLPNPLAVIRPLHEQILEIRTLLGEKIALTMPSTITQSHIPETTKPVLGHEMWHMKQFRQALLGCIKGKRSGILDAQCYCSFINGDGEKSVVTGNNAEAEADIMGTIATQNPCLAYFFAKLMQSGSIVPTNLDMNNGESMLSGASNFDPHPYPEHRVALALKTYINYKKVRESLTSSTFSSLF